MVSPVDPAAAAARLAALMRSAFEERGLNAPARPAGKPDAARSTAPGGSAAQKLQARVKALTTGPSGQRGAVVRLLVETMLAREFGEHLINEPLYQGIVDDVSGALDDAPALRADLDRVVAHLTSIDSPKC